MQYNVTQVSTGGYEPQFHGKGILACQIKVN